MTVGGYGVIEPLGQAGAEIVRIGHAAEWSRKLRADDLVDVILLNIRQQENRKWHIRSSGLAISSRATHRVGHVWGANQAGWKRAGATVIVVQRQTKLLQVVAAAHTGRGFTNLLHCRQQKPNENCDDRDHDQQLDERKSKSITAHHEPIPPQEKNDNTDNRMGALWAET